MTAQFFWIKVLVAGGGASDVRVAITWPDGTRMYGMRRGWSYTAPLKEGAELVATRAGFELGRAPFVASGSTEVRFDLASGTFSTAPFVTAEPLRHFRLRLDLGAPGHRCWGGTYHLTTRDIGVGIAGLEAGRDYDVPYWFNGDQPGELLAHQLFVSTVDPTLQDPKTSAPRGYADEIFVNPAPNGSTVRVWLGETPPNAGWSPRPIHRLNATYPNPHDEVKDVPITLGVEAHGAWSAVWSGRGDLSVQVRQCTLGNHVRVNGWLLSTGPVGESRRYYGRLGEAATSEASEPEPWSPAQVPVRS